MNTERGTSQVAHVAVLIALIASIAPTGAGAAPLRIVTTVPNLAALAREVGGDDVEVKSLGRGGEDPHFVEARPSFIRELHRADVFAYIGLGLELGWAPVLVRKARNSAVQPGGAGDFDASKGVPLLQVMTGTVDRSMGDVHPAGNPHYLLDPVNGLRVARRLRDLFAAARPERADGFVARTRDFETRLIKALVGAEVAAALGVEEIAEAALREDLGAWLAEHSASVLGGWLGAAAPHLGARVVADHDLWPHFAARFGLEVVDFLEPMPGITPTTRHLGEIAAEIREEKITAILSAAYFHPRYAEKVASVSGAKVVPMANQVGAREGIEDYLGMVDYNVRSVLGAL